MFNGATTFDQLIGNWDVSEGTNFVSTDQSVSLNGRSFCSVSNLDAESIHHWCVAFEGPSALNQTLFSFFRALCFSMPQTLINPLVTGMSPKVPNSYPTKV
jgi:hypothetical protein